MSQAVFEHFPDRTLIRVEGADCVHFLQNIVTCGVTRLSTGQAAFGALLTPQGKILFDFFLIRTANGFLIDVAESLSAELRKRLMFYRLRAKVSVEPAEPELAVFAVWGNSLGAASGILVQDPRLAAMGMRLYGTIPPDLPVGDYSAHRIALGMPQGGDDFAYGDTFPHEALMDQYGGVDFTKGCYVGQEVVSRMQHRGTARTRVLRIDAEQALPPAGTDVTAGERTIGRMGSSSGTRGLAMIRLDRAKSALDNGAAILAGGTTLRPSIPDWAGFEWPGVAEAE